jgi:hypothetical protein
VAHDLVILGVPFDSWRLFNDGEGTYRLWLEATAEHVRETRHEIHEAVTRG